ncbi:ATP-dependent RNA helicase RhlE [Ekhidna lutea]|uniref:ATP-dependent RNA helicase RhlE n=1 Tax=Ekhidna lutea TaxID=447679 RepID=A0A239GXG2_EKHLU|nr:DEAD/DEAH box helicase [Ekhidna lutea]SNS73582.1 ATP-dependent RNA helicase RhlE [Ekhidna lutea]
MNNFEHLDLSNSLQHALEDLGFHTPTPIQEQAYNAIRSGKDLVGISQTGTGKTFAYLLPLLRDLKFSKEIPPRVLIIVPTRELVGQVVEQLESLTTYMNIRVLGVHGGKNINTQKPAVVAGMDVLVGTPGRLYDLVLHKSLSLKSVKKVVIDEVDVLLDLGFRFQLTNIFDMLPTRRQHIMFSATMTEEVDELIDDYFSQPEKITIALSGTPLENITQVAYKAPNFYTKVELVKHLLVSAKAFPKVLVFVSSKRNADRLYEEMEETYEKDLCIIHSNKSQNYRQRSLEAFNEGKKRILIATDVIARGLDLTDVSHVVNMDVPIYPENYMHRIGRTGRAEKEGSSILLYTEKETEQKVAIEKLMKIAIAEEPFPEEVERSNELLPEERPKDKQKELSHKLRSNEPKGEATHEKKDKNKKTNLGGSYRRKLAKKYKKPLTRGDKNQNRKKRK